ILAGRGIQSKYPLNETIKTFVPFPGPPDLQIGNRKHYRPWREHAQRAHVAQSHAMPRTWHRNLNRQWGVLETERISYDTINSYHTMWLSFSKKDESRGHSLAQNSSEAATFRNSKFLHNYNVVSLCINKSCYLPCSERRHARRASKLLLG